MNSYSVDKVFKGEVSNVITANSVIDVPGDEYLFFASYKDENNEYRVNTGEPCSKRSPSVPLTNATQHLIIINFLLYYPVFIILFLSLLIGWHIKKKREIK